MSLLTYEDARPHAKAIRDEIGDGNMPPWHADPKHGKFANDRSLTGRRSRHAARDGPTTARPRATRRTCRAPPQFVDGWMIGEPDLVLTIPRIQGAGRGLRRVPGTSSSRPTSPRTDGSRRSRSGPAIAQSSITSSSSPDRPSRSAVRPASSSPRAWMSLPGRPAGRPSPTAGRTGARPEPLSRGRSGPASSIGGFAPGTVDHGLRSPGSAHAPPRGLDDRRCRCTTPPTARRPSTGRRSGSSSRSSRPTEEVRFANLVERRASRFRPARRTTRSRPR